MKQLLVLFSVLLCSTSMFAQHRSEQEAMQIAQEFFNPRPAAHKAHLAAVPQSQVQAKLAKHMAKANHAPAQNSASYIINDEANNRFVIVSADERMYKILGYSDNGTFDAEKAPDGMIDILGGYSQTYDFILSHDESLKTVHKANYKEVLPLIKTQWHQISPYNADCPDDPLADPYSIMFDALGLDETSVTGCVATAMAQVMNYHKYPSVGQGNVTYFTRTRNIKQSLNFSEKEFNWGNMVSSYVENNYTEAQKDAVAYLMHACGVSVRMDYGCAYFGGSGAQNPDLAYALIHYFNYNPNIRHYSKNYFTSSIWHEMIHEDLESGRPVIYTGMGQSITETGETIPYGHAFIIDGCNAEGLYHVNWGYNGESDGYFELSALEIEGSSFNLDQAMICNITPNRIGESEELFVADQFGFGDWLSNNTVGGISNSSYLKDLWCYDVHANTYDNTFNGEIGIGLFDEHLNFIKSLSSVSVSLNAFSGYSKKILPSFYYDAATFKNGKCYNVAAYAKGVGTAKPTILRTTYGISDFYNIEVEDGKIIVKLGPIFPKPIYKPKEGTYKVSALDASNLPKEWEMQLVKDINDTTIYWLSNIDPEVSLKIGTNSPIMVKAMANEMGNLTINISEQNLPGNLKLKNYSSSGYITINVKSETELSISDVWGIIDVSSDESLSRYSKTEMHYWPTPDVINKPIIIINDNLLSIVSTTDGCTIYYSFSPNGSEPNVQYESPIEIKYNGVVKAIAERSGKKSEVASEIIDWFVVEKPVISANDNIISINCATSNAIIFYTTDGTKPTVKNGKHYFEPFPCNEKATIMAFAIRENWKDSEIDTLYLPPKDSLLVEQNKAGELSNRVSYADKLTTEKMTVTGELNGSDIKFIREMINDGILAYLDIKNARIVDGGDYYYESYSTKYKTEENVVGEYMFYRCNELVSLKLPSTAFLIKSWAISSCANLKHLELPLDCKEIKANSIQNCNSLETVAIPANVEYFGESNLSGCQRLGTITVDKENKYYSAFDGVLYNNGTLVKYPMGKTDASFVVPNTVTTIGNYAFQNAQFENVTLPETVTSIGNSAFQDCKILKSIVIPNSVTTIGHMAFWGCTDISELTMSSEVTTLENNLFQGCKSLEEYTIGKNIAHIENNAFDGCVMLQRFIVDEDNVVYSEENGILYNKDMKILKRCPIALYADELRISDGVEIVASHAFDGCVNIGSFILPSTLRAIESSAFSSCGMSSIVIPSSITSIDYMAFYDCDKLETFVIPENLDKVNSMTFYGCKSLEYVYIPANVREFESSAFYGCKSLLLINSKIKDIEKVEMAYSEYSGNYSVFGNLPDTCTWIVPSGPVSDIDKYARKYMEQPWWVPTWRIKVSPQEELSIALASDVVTFCSVEDLDFNNVVSGSNTLKAYIASGFNPTTNTVVLLHVNEVPARTGLVLVGKAGTTYEVPYRGTDYVYSNLLKGVLSDTEITSGFILNNGEFIAANGTSTVKAGEAYLDIDGVSTSRLNLRFVEPEELGVDDVTGITNHQNSWHTLQGVRLDGQPTQPGIYLHGGRKVMVK